jgi:hypothetical protein
MRGARGFATLAALLSACRSAPSEPSEPGRPASATPAVTAAPALAAVTITDMPESERGGTLVLLLHGYGAAGDDLVPLARELVRPRARFVVPAAPLPSGAGRAWWSITPGERPAHAWSDMPPADYRGSKQLVQARRA